jgi:hypothetical protein
VIAADAEGSIMSPKSRWSLLLALSFAALGGPAQADLGPFPARRPPGPEPRPNYCNTVLVRSVESAEVARTKSPRIIVRGTVPTGGWRDAALRFRGISGAGRRRTAVYEFTGCRPEIATQVISPISADLELRIVTRGGTVRRILIKAATNSTLLDLDAPRSR